MNDARRVKTERTGGSYGKALFEQAEAQTKVSQFKAAEQTLRRLVAAEPDHAAAHLLLGRVLRENRKHAEAAVALRRSLELEPTSIQANLVLAIVLREMKRLPEAEFALRDILAMSPDHADALLELGNVLSTQGRRDDARAALQQLIDAKPNYAPARFNLGNLLRETGQLEEAAATYRQAVECNPDMGEAYFNLGITLSALGRKEEALDAYDQVTALQPKNVGAHNNRGQVLLALDRLDGAAAAFRRAIASDPGYGDAYYNLARTLRRDEKHDAAIKALQQGLARKPDHIGCLLSLAAALRDLKKDADKAAALYRRILAIEPNNQVAREGLIKVLKSKGDFVGAVQECGRLLALVPDHPEGLATLCHVKATTGDWRGRDEEFARLKQVTLRQIAANERTSLATFSSLARPLSPDVHLAMARTWARDTERAVAPLKAKLNFQFPPGRTHERLRIGYVSQDFRNQAMGHLTRNLYGQHDRANFEIFLYSVFRENPGKYRDHIKASVEHFTDIDTMTMAEGAKRIYEDEIDILVDLMGFTEEHRMGIVALRPAPIVIGWLRFPGTSGADFIDYMFTDQIVTTPEDRIHYSENLIFLPDAVEPTDWKQEISDKTMTRAEHNLPDDAFVFCCFNNNFKIEPFIFDLWMRIMRQVPNSVLWLLRFSEQFEANLRREAEARGIAGSRLIFGRKLGKDEHLARHRLADLFLDTRYFNAHTTGTDSLWAGLPLLTCPGETFASRYAASLLRAAGLPELVVPDFDVYERLAVRLATHPAEMKSIRDKLAARRLSCRLFDTPRYARKLERAYRMVWDNHLAGNPPREMVVADE
jgi:predicted O-linked N-acetylglucosamine transferase (SPINDLY family)